MSDHQLEEHGQEREGSVDDATSKQGLGNIVPPERKLSPAGSARYGSAGLDKTDITINGPWSDLDGAMDQMAQIVDFLPTLHCAEQAATHFLP